MLNLENEELKNVKGGGLTLWGAVGIVTGVIFVIGVIDGLIKLK
ncbi:MAG: class IIb bacteriocin, lactobin A/cerein 7B family [Bacilli bacterium]|nr:class IIb bacteriocin, lactobin A/cerein 7B family [Bacilli bacterium]